MLLRRLARLDRVDRAALGLLVAFFVWAAISAILQGHTMPGGSPYFWAPVFMATGVAAGRWAAPRPWLPPAGILVVSFCLWSTVTTGASAGSGPLGYANANAALGILLAAVAGLVSLGLTGVPRVVLILTALGALTMPALGSSKAGVAVSVLVAFAGLAMLLRRPPSAAWPLALGPVILAAAAAIVGWGASHPRLPHLAEAALDPARHQLWRDAYALWLQSPITGSGPGSFARFSPLAADPDTATAHSALLQVAAETGLIGIGLWTLLIAAGFVLAGRASRRAAWLAAAAWTALAVHSFADHLLEFPAVTFTAGVVLGLAGRVVPRSPEADRVTQPAGADRLTRHRSTS